MNVLYSKNTPKAQATRRLFKISKALFLEPQAPRIQKL